MDYTISEKILLAHTNEKEIGRGDIVDVSVDRVMVHDFFVPFCFNKFRDMDFKKVFDPDKIVIIWDHLVPASFQDDYRHHRMSEEFSREFGIKNVHRADGVCHQLMHENGYVKPGDIVLGTDSHTTTYGALGLLSTGIGYTEMAAVLGTGRIWLKNVPTLKFNIEGTLKKGVFSKDIILKILGDIKADGAAYKIMEFTGSTIRNMTIDSRLTISNMSVEAGAKAGIMEPDEKTVEYLSMFYPKSELKMLTSDPKARFENVYEYKAETIEPLVACPHNVDNIKKAAELENTTIDEAFLGSCTNGRLEDLEVAARILKGRKINPNVRFYVVPASRKIHIEAIKMGYIATLVEAGAIVNHAACSLCAGRSGGILENGERVISSNNRNFLGRMGGNKVEIFLGSPATVAASALEGRITEPRKYLL